MILTFQKIIFKAKLPQYLNNNVYRTLFTSGSFKGVTRIVDILKSDEYGKEFHIQVGINIFYFFLYLKKNIK